MATKKDIPEENDIGMKRCNIMMPKKLHKKLRRYAFENEVSMSSIIAKLVEEYLQQKK